MGPRFSLIFITMRRCLRQEGADSWLINRGCEASLWSLRFTKGRQLNPRVACGSDTWQFWETQNQLRADPEHTPSDDHKDKRR